MHSELTVLDEIINRSQSEVDHTERVYKEISRPARADKTLLEERRDRLKISQTELGRMEREIKESGEKAVLRVLSRCGDENGRQVRDRLATSEVGFQNDALNSLSYWVLKSSNLIGSYRHEVSINLKTILSVPLNRCASSLIKKIEKFQN